jgi:hypothetical protein
VVREINNRDHIDLPKNRHLFGKDLAGHFR